MGKKEPRGLGDARNAYSEYLRRKSGGEKVDFDDFCSRRPELESGLRSIHECVLLGQSLSTSRYFHQSIRDRLGDVDEITLSVERHSAPPDGPEGEDDRRGDPASAAPGSRYEPRGELARGGMGVIYRVEDRDLKRTIAMKVMLAPPGSEEESSRAAGSRSRSLARFLEEAKVTAQLEHPGIVPVHELGLDGEGRIYFTMRLVKGKELNEIFQLARDQRGNWNLPRAVGVLVKACQAVAFAHAKGVVHRDLKPSNIMVGRFGEVYVMDWGLAKVKGKKDLHDIRLKTDSQLTFTTIRSDRQSATAGGVESPLITMDGSVVGTPAFMPPEQALGRVEEVDQASDVYSLGAILYSLLTGQAPYVEPGAKMSPRTILAAVTQGPPRPVRELRARCRMSTWLRPAARAPVCVAPPRRYSPLYRLVGAPCHPPSRSASGPRRHSATRS